MANTAPNEAEYKQMRGIHALCLHKYKCHDQRREEKETEESALYLQLSVNLFLVIFYTKIVIELIYTFRCGIKLKNKIKADCYLCFFKGKTLW